VSISPIAPNWHDTPQSSQVSGFGYDPSTQVLTVSFVSTGTTYDYFGVPQNVFDEMVAAESTGSYFIRNIKRGPYRYQRRAEVGR